MKLAYYEGILRRDVIIDKKDLNKYEKKQKEGRTTNSE